MSGSTLKDKSKLERLETALQEMKNILELVIPQDDLKGIDFLPMFYHVRQKVDFETQLKHELPEKQFN